MTNKHYATFHAFLLDALKSGYDEFLINVLRSATEKPQFYIRPKAGDGAAACFEVKGNVLLPVGTPSKPIPLDEPEVFAEAA